MKLPKKGPPHTNMRFISALRVCILRTENSKFPSARRERKPPGRVPGVGGPGAAPHLRGPRVRPARRPTAPFRGRGPELRLRRGEAAPPDPSNPSTGPRPAAGPAPHPAERGAAPGNSPPGAAAGGGRAAPSPRGFGLSAQEPQAPPPPGWSPSDEEHRRPQAQSSSAAGPLEPRAPPSVNAAGRRVRAEAGSAQTRARALGGGAGGGGGGSPSGPRRRRPPPSSCGRCCFLSLHSARKTQGARCGLTSELSTNLPVYFVSL